MKNYGVLKGKVLQFTRDNDTSPHSELLVNAADELLRVSVNVRSSQGHRSQRLIEYKLVQDLGHPVIPHLRSLSAGWHDLALGNQRHLAIDYIRSNLFRPSEMRPIIHSAPGPNNDLFELLEALLKKSVVQEEAWIYAYGERWGPEWSVRDPVFRFLPTSGVHLVHMNQGDPGDSNTIFTDGALLFDFPQQQRAMGIFLKFQNQHWHTDDQQGYPLPDSPQSPVIQSAETVNTPWPVLPAESPYRLARIVAIVPNPKAQDAGRETVTLLNLSSQPLSLNGWRLVDHQRRSEQLRGGMTAYERKLIILNPEKIYLANQGGTLTLLNHQSLKVDGVSYRAEDVATPGTVLTFSEEASP